MNRLLEYLTQYGILLCNANAHLPSLETIGCTWQNAAALIDSHQLFYCKAFQNRTTYLSAEVYYLLKAVKQKPPLTGPAETLYSVLQEAPGLDTAILKRTSGLSPKAYQAGFSFLLQNLYITALQNGKQLTDNWSTFYYGTAAEWERHCPNTFDPEDPLRRLQDILSRTMSDRLIQRLVG